MKKSTILEKWPKEVHGANKITHHAVHLFVVSVTFLYVLLLPLYTTGMDKKRVLEQQTTAGIL